MFLCTMLGFKSFIGGCPGQAIAEKSFGPPEVFSPELILSPFQEGLDNLSFQVAI
jgi:hypothetical protein